METVAWLVLRIVYAGLYLHALKTLLSDWPATVKMVKLIAPWRPDLASVAMVGVMIVFPLCILLGAFGQVAGFVLIIYNLLGVKTHYRLANSAPMKAESQEVRDVAALAFVGHVTSAQKNYVLAAQAFYFMIVGTGPWSLTGNLF